MNRTSAALFAGLIFAAAPMARATLIYHESFTELSYPVGFTNTTPNVGGVWTNTTGSFWGGGTNDDQIVSGSLTAPAGTAALSSTGGKLNFEDDDSKRAVSTMTSGVGADDTTAYASFLLDLTQGSDGSGTGFTGLEFYSSTSNRVVKAGWLAGTYAVTKGNDEAGVSLVADQVNFVVLQFNYVAGNDTVDVYINPTASDLLAGTFTGQLTGLDFSTSFVGLANFNDGQPSGYVDEIRVGTSLSDVAMVIPEPGVVSLLLLGGGLAFLRRRRSASV